METVAPPTKEDAFDDEPTVVEYSETLFPQRILAGVIDYVIASFLVLISMAILPDLLGFVANLVFVAYLLFKDSIPFLGGQSFGKKITKIQAVTESGEPLTKDLKAGLIRNVFAAIPILAIVEVFILQSREKAENAGSRLGDDFAKTKVIFAKDEEDDDEEA